LAAYVEELASVIGRKDRIDPLRAYCTGLTLPWERKSVEPMYRTCQAKARERQRNFRR
jgi:SRSO17 transposase